MRKILTIAICFGLCCVFSQVGISSENTPDYPLNIQVQLSKDATVNPMLMWKVRKGVAFEELAGLTIFDINTGTGKGQTKFLIRDLNKGKVIKEDYKIDLGKHAPGKYEVWIEQIMKKKKYSNKVIYTIH